MTAAPGAWRHTCMTPGDEATCQGCREGQAAEHVRTNDWRVIGCVCGWRAPGEDYTAFDRHLSEVATSVAEIGEADLTRWLREWVRVHGGTDLRDTAGRLVLVCRCGKALGPSYGPTETGGRDPEERETVAYFQHQAADLLAAFTISTPPGAPQ